MRFESRVFWVEKDAREPEQYQDAFSLDAERGVAAIADGVTSGIFSGPWARLLTQAVVVSPPRLDSDGFSQWLAEQRAGWRGAIDTSRLTWFQRPKMADGGMTTLLWVEIEPTVSDGARPRTEYRAQSFAIGDSCLFHMRAGALVSGFPMANTADFGLNPAVLRSVDRKVDHLLEFQARDFTCSVGDMLVLCTDAVALWAMTRYEAGESVDWESYWDVGEATWREEIFRLRESGSMRYDDSTLMLLRVIPDPAWLSGDSEPSEIGTHGERESMERISPNSCDTLPLDEQRSSRAEMDVAPDEVAFSAVVLASEIPAFENECPTVNTTSSGPASTLTQGISATADEKLTTPVQSASNFPANEAFTPPESSETIAESEAHVRSESDVG